MAQTQNNQYDAKAQPPQLTAEKPPQEWMEEICEAVYANDIDRIESSYIQLECRRIKHKLSLIYPHDLEQKQPALLKYLQGFAKQNNLDLIRERRVTSVKPIYECRIKEPPMLALGVGVLLQQTGLIGSRHLHLSDSEPAPQLSGKRFAKLLKISAQISKGGKQVNLKPNRFLVSERDHMQALQGSASKVVKGDQRRIFSLFKNDYFRAIGYTQRLHFIFHVFAGGGQLDNSSLWGPLDLMTREPIHLRVYTHPMTGKQYGLLYTSYTLDLGHTADEKSWWNHRPKQH